MDHYADLTLKPDPEFALTTLMSVLMQKLHRALALAQSTGVGVSFPAAAERTLGATLRLHAGKEDLEQLLATEWLTGMRELVQTRAPAMVPAACGYRRVQRVQPKSAVERIRRRHMRRHNVSVEEANQRIPDAAVRRLRAPYVEMASSSTAQRFRLFILQGELLDQPIYGKFSTYGLAQEATIPWF